MSALLGLASRCEAATGPDRQLDNAIANAIRRPLLQGEPFYTASLDAAMTLVPEGWSLSLGERIGMPEHVRWAAWLHDHNTFDKIATRNVEGNAPSAALALCAAALRSHYMSREG